MSDETKKIDFDAPLVDYKGDVLVTPVIGEDGQAQEKKEVILKEICCNALMAQRQGETLTGIEHCKRESLATKVYGNKEDLTPTEISLISDLVSKTYPPLFVGPVFRMLGEAPK